MPGPAHKAVWHTSIALGKVSGQQDGRAAGATRISGTPLLAGGRYEEKAVPRSGVLGLQPLRRTLPESERTALSAH